MLAAPLRVDWFWVPQAGIHHRVGLWMLLRGHSVTFHACRARAWRLTHRDTQSWSPNSISFHRRDCSPKVNRDARVLYCENDRLHPVLNDWLRRMVVQTLYGHSLARTIVLTCGLHARRHEHGKRLGNR